MSAVDKARAAWGDALPDWVLALARECDTTSQSKAAKRLGYSAGAISTILAGKYRASMESIERSVRAKVMAERVACPVLGELGLTECGQWQARVEDFVGVNMIHVRMFKACPKCAHFQKKTQTGKD